MRGRRVRDATKKERQVCARRRDGEPAGSRKTAGVAYFTRPPRARQDALLPTGIHRGFFLAENNADRCRSFVAVERSMSDRLPTMIVSLS